MLTVCRSSDADFGLFEVRDLKSGDRTCLGYSNSPKSGVFETLLPRLCHNVCNQIVSRTVDTFNSLLVNMFLNKMHFFMDMFGSMAKQHICS